MLKLLIYVYCNNIIVDIRAGNIVHGLTNATVNVFHNFIASHINALNKGIYDKVFIT